MTINTETSKEMRANYQPNRHKSSNNTKLTDKINNPFVESELLTFPNQPIIWSIIDGPNKGQIYELSGGKGMIIIGNFERPLIFIAGEIDDKAFNLALNLCPDDAFIYCQPSYHRWFLKEGWQILSRVQLTYSNPSPITLREGLIIKPIDNLELFERCCWFDKIASRYYGSPQNFFAHGEGYTLCNEQQQILAEVYAAFIGRNHVEIGIVTHPDFRQQSAATQIISYFAEKLRTEGKIPIWSCRTDNPGSLKTALKIGFEINQYYIQLIKNQ